MTLSRITLFGVVSLLMVACGLNMHPEASPPAQPISEPSRPPHIHRIQHVILIDQENHSFDNYFGTYPGADGIPMRHGAPVACEIDRALHGCVRPFHDPSLRGAGGPHDESAAIHDVAGGAMDGFVRWSITGRKSTCGSDPLEPSCSATTERSRLPDVLGWHDAREIPNYWAYASHYVLQDHMFEAVPSWSLPSHLAMVSGWSAACREPRNPMTCRTFVGGREPGEPSDPHRDVLYPWTDITYLLDRAHVSWRYYVAPGTQPDCADGAMFCPPAPQRVGTPEIWNPLPDFQDVQQDRQLANIQPANRFLAAANRGTLPAVSWIVPNQRTSEHPPASIAAGQAWVTRLVDAVMRGGDWSSSAIFVTWDDWGGFFDHVTPPIVGGSTYGLRVPGLVISPYARSGFIDSQLLSSDAYLRFIEDVFLHGQRLDPTTDGRPDSRPTVFETTRGLGNLMREFDFAGTPVPALILSPHPAPGPPSETRRYRIVLHRR